MKILLIDNDPEDLFLFSKKLESLGIEYDTCGLESQALAKLTSGDYNYAFVDYKLNTINSDVLIFAAKGIISHPETKIYLMSHFELGYVTNQTKLIQDYIVKVIEKSKVEEEFEKLAHHK